MKVRIVAAALMIAVSFFGCTSTEAIREKLVDILKREGVADAINMDGGGSTSLVVFDRESNMPRMLNHQPKGIQRKVGMNLGIAF